jgi:hypothetical protein
MIVLSIILVVIGISLLVYAFRSKIFRKGGKKMNIDLGDILLGAIVFLAVIVAIFIISVAATQKTITIDSKIDHIDYLDSYMFIKFNDGRSYNVAYPYDDGIVTDFDKSTNVAMKLRYTNLFWCLNTGDVWTIDNIIKY